ncbi:MAG: fused MFS/spermidine synthase [Planctomycetes bacterium]|nr:fused MFS/spermidine synthase [Planctomycetota bacterium]
MPRLHATTFLLFVLSGFCGLVYQIVWLRLAFAAFGIVTPVLSILLSAFMAGLALGSWLGGRLAGRLVAGGAGRAAVAYGLVEWGIALGAVVVPWVFGLGEQALLAAGEASSAGYLLPSAAWLAGAILPFATLMGATFPLMMGFLRARAPGDERTFSWLYLGNVIGAMLGAAATAAVLIECLGFRSTLLVAAAGNVAIGLLAFGLARQAAPTPAGNGTAVPRQVDRTALPTGFAPRTRVALLFATGFTSMAMEVAWTRAFTPVLWTTIYAFAGVLTTYLFATWLGSFFYRRHLRQGTTIDGRAMLALLFVASLLPLVLNDPRLHQSVPVVLASIVPISALLGYLTPQLIDEHARGEPGRAGTAYAVNVFGCILGPLFAGYLVLPALGVQWTLLACAAVYPAFLALAHTTTRTPAVRILATLGLLLAAAGTFVVRTHEDPAAYAGATGDAKVEVRRDHVASVVAYVADEPRDGPAKDRMRMLVNGVGITHLTPLTKVMAHLPLVLREAPPESTLVICFGMGTTFRSLATWGGRVTAVELVPSVAASFGFYHADADAVLARPGSRIVIDDGRRFLKRTAEKFDLITLDPPPPVEAAGSSLLYSREFYEVVKARLSPTGVLQQWFPGGEAAISQAAVNTVAQAFPHVLVYRSFETPEGAKEYGIHLLAAMWPIAPPTIERALAKMPPAAVTDLLEWVPPGITHEQAWHYILKMKVDLASELPANRALGITDDRPFNEYFLLRRRLFGPGSFLENTLPR